MGQHNAYWKCCKIPKDAVAYCSLCQNAFIRRQLGICEGKLVCGDCWPDDVSGSVVETAAVDVSPQGFRLLRAGDVPT